MRILLPVCLALSCSLTWADRSDVIALRHKIPEDLLQPLRQTFPEAGIQAFNGQLIVRAPDNATFQRIVDLVAKLDSATRTLRITVEQRENRGAAETRIDTQARIVASNRGADGQVVISGDAQERRSTGSMRQVLNTQDGSPATIQLGSQRFIPRLSFIYRPDYRMAVFGGEWQVAGTGLYVEPHLIGDQVQLRLAPETRQFSSSGTLQARSLYSQVQGRLGEWLPVGEMTQQLSADARGAFSGTDTQRLQTWTVWVRVDAAGN